VVAAPIQVKDGVLVSEESRRLRRCGVSRLILHLPKTLGFADVHAAVLRLPVVERGFADVVLS
jgi:hypothetical protein